MSDIYFLERFCANIETYLNRYSRKIRVVIVIDVVLLSMIHIILSKYNLKYALAISVILMITSYIYINKLLIDAVYIPLNNLESWDSFKKVKELKCGNSILGEIKKKATVIKKGNDVLFKVDLLSLQEVIDSKILIMKCNEKLKDY